MSMVQQAARYILGDVNQFSKHIIGKPLRRYQAEVAATIVANIINSAGGIITVEMSRQAGKNETSAIVEAYLLNLFQRRGGQIVKASPTFKPQTVNSIMRLSDRLNNAWNAGQAKRSHGYMISLGNARAIFFSAQPKANVIGATASIALETDEAQDVSIPKWTKDFAPMAASTNAVRIMYGTAWTRKTLLAQSRAEAHEQDRRTATKSVFRIPSDVVAAEVPEYGLYVASEERRLGRNHPLFRTQYLLEEIDDDAGLFTAARVAMMHADHPRQHQPTPGHLYAITIDLAGADDTGHSSSADILPNTKRDSTAVSIFEVDPSTTADPLIAKPTYRLVDRKRWTNVPHAQLYGQIVGLIEHWSPRYIVPDATGIGEGLTSFLLARYRSRVLPFVFSQASKSDLAWQFVAIVETGRFRHYAEDQAADTRQFWYEVEACTYELHANQRITWGVDESPAYDGLIDRGHDDTLISAALCAVLDQQPWGLAHSAIVPAPDPLARQTSF